MSDSPADRLAATPLSGTNADFIESLYQQFLQDPKSVDASWARYFASVRANGLDIPQARDSARAARPAVLPRAAAAPDTGAASAKQAAVSRLIQVYANRGHLIAHLDPLGLTQHSTPFLLDPGYFGLTEADMETEFFTGSRNSAIPARSKLKEILAQLKFIYCDTIGAEFAHVSDTEERLWLQDHFQSERMQ